MDKFLKPYIMIISQKDRIKPQNGTAVRSLELWILIMSV